MKISTLRIGIAPAIALLLLGILVGALLPLPELGDAANRSQAEQAARTAELAETAANSEERIWKLYRERESLMAQLEAAEASPAVESSVAPTPPSDAGTFTDGIHIVGADIKPGTYDGRVTTGDSGYWARLKSTDGTVNSIITNGIAEGPFVLTLAQTDRAVELRGITLTRRD